MISIFWPPELTVIENIFFVLSYQIWAFFFFAADSGNQYLYLCVMSLFFNFAKEKTLCTRKYTVYNFWGLAFSNDADLFHLLRVAAAAKSPQSLCDPTDSSPPGSAVPGILQARTLEWVAISFSNA